MKWVTALENNILPNVGKWNVREGLLLCSFGKIVLLLKSYGLLFGFSNLVNEDIFVDPVGIL